MSKIKISIITTAPNVRNYGAVLQAYATKCLFEEKGFEVEFVDRYNFALNEVTSLPQIYQVLDRSKAFGHWPKPLKWGGALLLLPSVMRSRKRFFGFVSQNIPSSSIPYQNEEELLNTPPEADVYCTGGDQMWNAQYHGHRTLPEAYLAYAPTGKPRVSFVTSIGKLCFDEHEIPEVVPLLKQYRLISVREDSAKAQLDTLGFKNVTHLQDPTLLLERNKWDLITKPSLNIPRYILVYEITPDKMVSKIAKQLAKKTGLKIVQIATGIASHVPGQNIVMNPVPEEFLSLFCNAEFVITNSFHGTAFSIIYQKNFISVQTSNGNRIKSLLTYLHLENRICTDPANVTRLYRETIDYTAVSPYLEQARHDCDDYIEKIKALVQMEKIGEE